MPSSAGPQLLVRKTALNRMARTSAVLHTLYNSDACFEEFINNSMTTAFPDDYDKLSFPPAEDGRVQMRLKRKHRKRADSAASYLRRNASFSIAAHDSRQPGGGVDSSVCDRRA